MTYIIHRFDDDQGVPRGDDREGGGVGARGEPRVIVVDLAFSSRNPRRRSGGGLLCASHLVKQKKKSGFAEVHEGRYQQHLWRTACPHTNIHVAATSANCQLPPH